MLRTEETGKVTNDEQASADLEAQMKQLLAKIEREPISEEIRALAEELQQMLEARQATEKNKG
jgi:hypothetical protein